MLASFKTFRGGFGELLVEISFPRSDEVLCTTLPEDLPCAHSQKFVGMVDLVVMCLGEGTDQNLGVLWKDDFIWDHGGLARYKSRCHRLICWVSPSF